MVKFIVKVSVVLALLLGGYWFFLQGGDEIIEVPDIPEVSFEEVIGNGLELLEDGESSTEEEVDDTEDERFQRN